MTYCTTPRKYPMIVRKVCPYCGKGNDILIHRWQENRQRMFCPGTNHSSLVRNKKEVHKEPDSKDYHRYTKPEVSKPDNSEYYRQLRKSYGVKGSL